MPHLMPAPRKLANSPARLASSRMANDGSTVHLVDP